MTKVKFYINFLEYKTMCLIIDSVICMLHCTSCLPIGNLLNNCINSLRTSYNIFWSYSLFAPPTMPSQISLPLPQPPTSSNESDSTQEAKDRWLLWDTWYSRVSITLPQWQPLHQKMLQAYFKCTFFTKRHMNPLTVEFEVVIKSNIIYSRCGKQLPPLRRDPAPSRCDLSALGMSCLVRFFFCQKLGFSSEEGRKLDRNHCFEDA